MNVYNLLMAITFSQRELEGKKSTGNYFSVIRDNSETGTVLCWRFDTKSSNEDSSQFSAG